MFKPSPFLENLHFRNLWFLRTSGCSGVLNCRICCIFGKLDLRKVQTLSRCADYILAWGLHTSIILFRSATDWDFRESRKIQKICKIQNICKIDLVQNIIVWCEAQSSGAKRSSRLQSALIRCRDDQSQNLRIGCRAQYSGTKPN